MWGSCITHSCHHSTWIGAGINIHTVGETSEAIGNRTQRDTRRAGALMANTGGLFGVTARRIDKTGGVSRVDTAVAKPILKNSFCSSRF